VARNNWSLNTFCSINWGIPEKALETPENSAQIFIIKFAHNHLSAGRHMHRIKWAKTDECPACDHIVKTDRHVLSCPKRPLWHAELLRALGDTLANNHTQPDLALMLLIQGIQGALSNQDFQTMNPNNRENAFRMLVNSRRSMRTRRPNTLLQLLQQVPGTVG
jgi:hypothetical protein